MKTKRRMTPDDALLRLADFCAAAEKCEFECRRKLMQWGISRDNSDRIIDYLYEHSFLDAARYARAYVRDKACFNKWGKFRIRRELSMRKIPSDIIRDAIEELSEEDYIRYAQLAAEAALRGIDTATPKGRRTFVRRMATRGYEWAIISKFLSDEADSIDKIEYEEDFWPDS